MNFNQSMLTFCLIATISSLLLLHTTTATPATRIKHHDDDDDVSDSVRMSVFHQNKADNSKSSFECPEKFGSFVNTEDCDTYYLCLFGKSYLKHCDSGKKFDSIDRECRSSSIARCYQNDEDEDNDNDDDNSNEDNNNNNNNGTVVDDNDQQQFECPFEFGAFVNTRNCDTFYLCLFGKSYLKHCDAGERFDSIDRECRPRAVARCYNGTENGNDNNVDDIIATNFTCPFAFGAFVNTRNCDTFFLCLFDKPYVKHCDSGERFDSIDRECRPRAIARCYNGTDHGNGNGNNNNNNGTTIGQNFTCPHRFGSFANLKNCSTFYLCLNDKPHLKHCPWWQRFDAPLGLCLPSSIARCGRGGGGGDGNNNSTDTIWNVEQFQCPTLSGVYQHAQKCNQYWLCINGRSHLQHCANGYRFDLHAKRCLLESVANCDLDDDNDQTLPKPNSTTTILF